MASPPAHALRCLKDAGTRSVWLIDRPGQEPRTVKTWPLTPLMILKMVLGFAQPQRQLRGSRRLLRIGVPTPEPHGRWRLGRDGTTWQVRLEMPFVPGRLALEMLQQGQIDEPTARRCGPQIGRIVRTLAGANLLHRDLKLENLVIAGQNADPVVWVIDTVGVRATWDRPGAVLQMLDRLIVQSTDQPTARQRWAWGPILREALAGLTAAQRRAVLARLRARLRS